MFGKRLPNHIAAVICAGTLATIAAPAWAIECEGNACEDILFRSILVPNPNEYNKVEVRNRNRDKSIKVCYGTISTSSAVALLGCFSGGVRSCQDVWPDETQTFDMPHGHRGVCIPISANYE